MSVQKTDDTDAVAREVIAAFLQENDEPTTSDWKQLIASYPLYADDIADAAFLHKERRHLEESDVAGPLNEAAYRAGVSKAVNLVHSIRSAQLADLEAKVSAVRGAPIRALASDVGLAKQPMLLSGILAGSVVAPAKVLLRLISAFDTSVMALTEFLRRSFDTNVVPAYKAEHGKPQVPVEPTRWAEAVRKLNLSPEETKELLSLDE